MIGKIIQKIKKEKPKKVFLQAPEGLKKYLPKINRKLKENNIESVISIDPCYGACDLKLNECEQLNCNLYVHLGHNEFYRNMKNNISNIKILYFPWKIKLKFNNWNQLNKIKENKIGLVSTVQYTEELEKVKEKLEEKGKQVIIAGQILGCWHTNLNNIKNNIDAVLYVGTGNFHPTGIKNKNVYKLDTEKNEIKNMKDEIKKLEKIRQWNISKAKKSDSFGILVSTKPGQFDSNKIKEVKNKLNKKGKDFVLLAGNEINKDNLMNFEINCLINTACPRLAEDDFGVPIINAEDLNEL